MKAPDVTYFWRHKAPFEHASYLGGSGGMLPQESFTKEHSETFPVFLETKYQFPRQSWNSLKFSLKSKIFNETRRIFAFTRALCWGETLVLLHAVSQGFFL